MTENINEKDREELEAIFEESKTTNLFKNIISGLFFKSVSYKKLRLIFGRVEELYFDLKNLFEKVEVERYIDETINIEELEEIYRKKKIDKKYPNFNFKKLKELYDSPPKSLKSPAYKHHIKYDDIITRKYIIMVMQMVFNNMDIVIAFCGREGTGKTTASTQDSYLIYYILKELGLVDYDYTLKNIMYYDLKSIIGAFNKYSQNPFRITILDEGNELNRKDWGNPLVQLFFQHLRRGRKHLRIIFINLPQLGELMPSLTLSRINFVHQLEMKPNIKTKLADKGACSFFIIPRFSKVYSYLNRKELNQEYIINELGKILDDKKKYFQKLPKYLCIHKYERNGVWSFNEKEYDIKSKEANEQFSTNSITLTKAEIYHLHKHFDLKKLGIKPGTKSYHILAHLKNKKLKVATKNEEEFEHYSRDDDGSDLMSEA